MNRNYASWLLLFSFNSSPIIMPMNKVWFKCIFFIHLPYKLTKVLTINSNSFLHSYHRPSTLNTNNAVRAFVWLHSKPILIGQAHSEGNTNRFVWDLGNTINAPSANRKTGFSFVHKRNGQMLITEPWGGGKLGNGPRQRRTLQITSNWAYAILSKRTASLLGA